MDKGEQLTLPMFVENHEKFYITHWLINYSTPYCRLLGEALLERVLFSAGSI